jgi:autotransporter-associated beta strand protein
MQTIPLCLIRPLSCLGPACLPLALLFGGASFQEACAASRFWDGSANGNFSTAANWVGSVAPVAGDDLVFQTGVTRLLVTNDFAPNRAFNSVLFQGSNYIVRGNAILVTNGINSINPVGVNRIDADVDVRASQPWEAQGALASIDVNGDINLNASTLTVRANTGDFFFSGVIRGTGSLVKTNVGTLRLDGGSGHNTYSGLTRFDGGVLELNKFATVPVVTNFTAIPGDLTIGDGNDVIGTDVCRLLADDQIADASDVTVKNSGLFDLNDNSDRIGSLSMEGGTVDSGAGTLTLGGNLTTMGDPNTATINGNLSLGGASRTFEVNSGAPAADLRINASISAGTINLFSTAGFTKTGRGSLFLAGTNTYNGTTTINDGQVALLTDRALGATATPLGASAPTVVNADGNLFLSNVQVTNEDLTINSPNPGGAFNASGAAVWTGDILLSTDAFISSSGSLLLNGAITGTGGFTKISGGSVTLAGTNANTYSGTTMVRDGTLLLDKDTAVAFGNAMSGPLVIGEDELPENTDIVRYLRCCQLPDDTDVTINASGLLDLNGFGDNVRNIVFNGGDLATEAAGSILPTGDITVNRNTNSQAVISGRMSLLSNPIINVTGHFFSPDLSITALLHGPGGFTKNGVGEVGLTAANTYSGQTTVNDGFLLVDHSSALGTTAGGTVVNSGAVLALRFAVAVPAEALTLAGTGQSSFGALSSSFGSNSWAGNITLSSNATISVDAGDFLNLLGGITGGSDLTKTGTGTLLFSGGTASSFDDLLVSAGTLVLNKSTANAAGPADLTIGDGSGADIVRLASDNQVADTTQIHIAAGGRFDLDDMNETTGAIDGRGVIDLGSGTLRTGADDGSSTLTGLIIGTGNLFKLGTGTWTLNGNNTYSGLTTVSAGTLVVNGSQPQSPVTVNGTGTLMGDGVIGNLQVFGSVAPGLSPAILTCSNVNFAAQGDYFVELNGPAPGTGHDQLNVRGTNQLGGSTLHVSVGAGFAPFEGDRLTILDNDGSEAIVGTFDGLPNGTVFTASGHQLRILYSDIFLNDVVLVVTNTALKLAADPIVDTGNGNNDIEPGECNLLRIALMNRLGGIVSGVSATLSSTNPGVTITQPFSAYPNLPASGTRSNTTPYQISTSPALLCGTNIDLVLTVTTATNGSFKVPIPVLVGTAGSPVRRDNTADLAIPDVGFVDSTINIAGFGGILARVTVSMNITHTAAGDLDLSLVGPDGTTIDLSSDNGGTGDDFGAGEADADRTTFSDLGTTAITAGAPPFRGTFRPEQALTAFRGKSGPGVNGAWRLRINDDAGGTLGTLRTWSLFLAPIVCLPGGGECEQCGGPIIGSIATGDGIQTDRLNRNGVISTCDASKPCPGSFAEGAVRFDAYTFTNVGPASCVTVSLDTPCNSLSPGDNAIHCSAYLGSYNPANKCANYLADSGVSSLSATYSFVVPASSIFVVIVNESDSGIGCTNYTLNVTGFECPQRLNIERIPANRVRLTWSTSAAGYNLLASPTVTPPGSYVPIGPEPVVTGSKFTVTNTTPGSALFYELRKP